MNAAKALADFDEALALDPANADAVRGRAGALSAWVETRRRRPRTGEAVDRQPGYWSHHNHLGAYLWRRGRYAEAEARFRRVVELVPDNARGHSNLGGLLHLMGRDEEAVVSLRRSLELRPNYAAASNLATIEFNRQRSAEAARHFETALALDDRDYRLWRNLAAAYHWAPGRREDARPAYRRAADLAEAAREVDPLDADLLAQLADCYAMLGEPDRARATLREALEHGSEDVEVMELAASVYETLGEPGRGAALARSGPREGLSTRARSRRDPSLVDLRDDPRYEALVLRRWNAGSSRRSVKGGRIVSDGKCQDLDLPQRQRVA